MRLVCFLENYSTLSKFPELGMVLTIYPLYPVSKPKSIGILFYYIDYFLVQPTQSIRNEEINIIDPW